MTKFKILKHFVKISGLNAEERRAVYETALYNIIRKQQADQNNHDSACILQHLCKFN